jgi:hypothetical protein
MEKLWYPQRNVNDAPIAVIKSLISYIQFPVSRETIENTMKSHRNHPNFALEDFVEMLGSWGLEAGLFKIEESSLKDLPPSTILFIHDKNGDLKLGQIVMLHELSNETIEYLHPRKGWVIEAVSDFVQKWEPVALTLLEAKSDGENDFEAKESEYERKRWSNPDLKNVRIIDDFLTDSECDHILNLSQTEFKRSKLFGEENVEGHGRTSSSAELHIFPNDSVLVGIRKRASGIIDIPESHFEFFQCVSYEPGQEYQNHYDTFDPTSERGRKAIETEGQRKYTLLAYLNDDFEGGSTYFPNLDLLVTPKKRRVVIFNNLDENGEVIKGAYHAGLPVTRGRKYAINIWVRNKPLLNANQS